MSGETNFSFCSKDGTMHFANPDRRSDQRRPIGCALRISWRAADGLTRSAHVRGIELSQSGVAIRSNEPFPPGYTLFVELPKYNLVGSGCVRHCTPTGSTYLVGIKFRGNLTRPI